MIHTDKYYANPVVYRLITCNADRYIQLDTVVDAQYDSSGFLKGTYMRPVSFVSNNAAVYPNWWPLPITITLRITKQLIHKDSGMISQVMS